MSIRTLTIEPWRAQAKPRPQAQERLTPAELQREYLKHKLEDAVQAEVVGYLTRERLPHAITNAEAAYNVDGQRVQRVPEGWPDLTACETGALCPMHAGKFFAIECKRAVGGTLTYHQARWLKDFYQTGALICVARSEEDVIEVRRTGVRACDLAEIEAALAKGPPVNKARAPRRVSERLPKNFQHKN